MNRAIYPLASALAAAMALTFMPMGAALAQSVPPVDRLTPLQRQQFSRDLVPSSAQDFFKAGQTTLEQDVRRLTRPRSPLKENLLKVSQDSPTPLNEHVEQPGSLRRDRAQ